MLNKGYQTETVLYLSNLYPQKQNTLDCPTMSLSSHILLGHH